MDVQKTNAQGHTALDIVNMYVDPRTASLMKQVLQGKLDYVLIYVLSIVLLYTDALAQLARSRIAQQHVAGHAPSSSYHPPSGPHQPSGFSYFPSSGQPVSPSTIFSCLLHILCLCSGDSQADVRGIVTAEAVPSAQSATGKPSSAFWLPPSL